MKIQKKFLLMFFLFKVPAAALSVWLSLSAVRAVLMDQLEDTAFSNAVKVAENIVVGDGFKNESAMLRQLNFAHQLTGAQYVAVTDNTNRFIAHTDVARKDGFQPHLDDDTAEIRKSGDYHMIETADGPLMEVHSPVWTKPMEGEGEELLLGGADAGARRRLGTVIIGIPLSSTLATQTLMASKIAFIIILSALLFAGAFLAVLRRILRPIASLEAEIKNIASGRYGHQVPEVGSDEIGGLAASFNQMSQALARTTISKDYMSAILENMLDPLLVIGGDRRVKTANRAAVTALGYAEGELIGRSVEEIFAEAHIWDAAAGTAGNPPASRLTNVEANLLTSHGNKVPVLFSMAALYDGSRILVARDITERRSFELVVRQSEKMSAVGQLAAGVAHEINNPLGVILGFAQALVRRVAPGDATEEALKSIEREAIRCKNLVSDLLTFSRVSNVEREPVDVNRAVESSISLIRTKARVSNVELASVLDENLPRVLGNHTQLQQVVINLSSNAVDAMASGGRLELRTERITSDSGEAVQIKVTDNGPGIPPQVLNRIFEPFFTTKGVGKGTGLGLSLVHEIVNKHGGSIDVASRPGCTCFTVTLPAAPAAATTEARP